MDADHQPPNPHRWVSCFGGGGGGVTEFVPHRPHLKNVGLLWTIVPAELLAPCSPEKLTQGICGHVLHGDGWVQF